jgi:hypothetical protein
VDTRQAHVFLEVSASNRWAPLAARGHDRTAARRARRLALALVDLDAAALTVVETVVVVDGEPLGKTTPSSAGSVRRVGLDPGTVEALRAWKRVRPRSGS